MVLNEAHLRIRYKIFCVDCTTNLFKHSFRMIKFMNFIFRQSKNCRTRFCSTFSPIFRIWKYVEWPEFAVDGVQVIFFSVFADETYVHATKTYVHSFRCLRYTIMAKCFTSTRSIWFTCRIIRIAASINICSIWTIFALHRTTYWAHHTYRSTWVGSKMPQFNVHVVGFLDRYIWIVCWFVSVTNEMIL